MDLTLVTSDGHLLTLGTIRTMKNSANGRLNTRSANQTARGSYIVTRYIIGKN